MNQRMWRTAFRSLVLTVLALGFVAGEVMGQAVPFNSPVLPEHNHRDQRSMGVAFNQALSGSTNISHWIVRINGTIVPTTGVSLTQVGGYGPSVSPTGPNIFIQFDANPVNVVSYLLPGQTLTISFINSAPLLTTAAGGAAVANFGPFTSKNTYVPNCTQDIIFRNSGPIALPDFCSPVNTDFFAWTYGYSLVYRNSNTWVTANNQLAVNWGYLGFNSNLQAYLSDQAGNPSPGTYSTAFFGGNPATFASFRSGGGTPFSYPDNTGICNFVATTAPFSNSPSYNSVGCPSLQNSSQFNSFDFDDGNTGILAMTPSVPPVTATSDKVCLGTNVGMRFIDTSTLNCVGNQTILPVPPNGSTLPLNNLQRYVRFIYGGVDFGGGNIPDIRVNGTQVTNTTTGAILPAYNPNPLLAGGPTTIGYVPTGAGGVGVPDANGVIQLPPNSTAPSLQSLLITTLDPSNQLVGQRFYVTIQYWDVCNPYDPFDLLNPLKQPVQNNSYYVEITSKPPALTTTGRSLCYNTGTGGVNFTATGGVGGRTAVNWYKDLASVGTATKMTNPNGGNSLNFPVTSYGGQGGLGGAFTTNNANGRYYSVWATQVVGAANVCESDPIEIVIYQQPRIDIAPDIPNAPAGAIEICNGPPGVMEVYTTNAPNTKTIPASTVTNGGAIDLPTENIWSVNAFAASVTLTPTTGNSTTVTYNIAPQPNPSDAGQVRVRRGYITSTNVPIVSPLPAPFTLPTYNINPQACLNNNVPLNVTVFGQSDGGTITGSPTICNGSSTGNMTLSGQRGAILQWERKYNAGPYVAIGGTAGLTVYSEVPPNGPGTYKYRALVQNQNAGGPCGPVTTIVANQNTVTVNPVPPKPTITSSGVTTFCLGGSVTLTSSDVGLLAASYRWYRNGVFTGTTSNNITLTTVAQSGDYTVEVIGIAPSNCASPTSDPTTVTINPLPTAPNPTGGGAVCSGNPAPDIEWDGLTGTAPFNITYTINGIPTGPIVEPTTTFTISNPLTPGTYQMTVLSDANGCSATVLGGSASVIIGGAAPVYDRAPNLIPTITCGNGASTSDPQLDLSLDPASTSAGTYILTYKINSGANLTKNFTLNLANGDPSAAITFSEVALNAVAAHTITVVSIQSPLGCLLVDGTVLNFTVRALPSISTQPSDAAICDLGNTSFSVVAAGTDVSYQWEEKVGAGAFAPLANGGVYSGVTTSTLTLTAAPLAMNSNQYRVIVTGYNPPSLPPLCPVTSSAATLTVNAYANITAQPVDAAQCVGLNRSFSVTAAGPGIAYRWQQDPDGPGALPFTDLADGPVGGVTYSGTGTTTLTLSSVTLALDASQYRVRLTTTGSCSVNSNAATLTVNPLPVAADPAPVLCDLGFGTVTGVILPTYHDAITGIVGSGDRSFQWFTNPARTISVPDINNVTVSNGTKFYNIVTVVSTGCVSNGEITFTVRPLPAKANQTVQICEDAPPGSLVASGINLQNFELAAAGGSMANRDIEWYEDMALTILIPPGAAAGAEQNYSFNADKTIHAKIIDTASPTVPKCFSQATLTLDYQARPNDNQITDGIGQVLGATYTVCASSNLVLLQINPGLNPGSTYTWTVPPVSYPGEFELLTGTTGFFIILRFPNPIPSGGSIYPTGLPISVKETLGTALCDGNTINTRIIVEGSPPKPIIAGPTSVCSGANGLVYSVTNPVAGSYSWTLPPGATITSLPVTASSITVQMSTFSGNVNVTHASGTGCTSPAADPYPVTVVARPSIASANTNTLCSGANVGAVHTLTSTIAGTTYNWQVINVTGFVSGALLGDFANGVLSINQTLTNTSGVTASVTYQVTPVGPGPDNCLGNPQNLTITVNPEPVIVAGQSKTICSGSPANFKILLTPAALPATTTFSWPVPMMSDLSVQGTSGAGVPQGDAIHIFDSFVNTSAAPITATYTISPVSGSACPGMDETVIITINPQPVGTDITRAAQCSNVAFNVSADNITNGVAGSTFTWVRNALPAGLTQVTGGSGTGPIAETLRNLTGLQLNATYVVTPTSGAGCPGATYVVSVPVDPEPVGTAITRAAQCSDVAFSVSADNITNGVAGTTFTWSRNSLPAGLTQVVAGTGVGPIAETLRNQTSGQLSATYVVTPTSGAGCLGATYVVTVPINPEPLGAAITRAQQCSNVAFNVSADNITNGVAGVTFTWVRNALPPGLTQVVAGTGVGAIAETLENLSGGQLNATYVVTPTSGAGCIGATYVVTVPVNPEPVGAAITRTAQCSNVAFSVSADNITNGVAGSTFTWVRNVLPAGLTQVAAGTGTGAIAETLSNLTGGQLNATYVVTPTSASGCIGASYVVTVPVNPEPVGAAITRAAQCSNVAFSVSADNITNAVAGVTFTWVRNPLPVGLTPVSAGTGVGPIAETLRNITGGQLSASYVVTPTSGAGCVGATYVVTVPIDPEPVGAAVTRAVQCSNVAFSVSADNITNGVAGSTFTWVRNALPPGLTVITAGTGVGAIAETLGNVTAGQLSATYTVTPTSGAGCLGADYVVTVPVNPEPVGADITRSAQCSNVAFSVSADNITNGVSGVTFTWVRNALPAGLTQVVAGTGSGAIAETLRNLTGGQLSASYVVTPTSGASCVGASYVVTVPINPEPVGAAITRAPQCSNVAFSLSADNTTNGVAGVTFTWVRNPLPAGLTPVTAGSGIGPIAETLRNLTGGQLSATYVVTPTSGAGCVGATYVVTVPVDPEPVGAAITRAAQCSEVAFSVSADNITNGVVGSTFTWVRNALPAGLTQVVAGTGVGPIAETLRNLTGGQLSATYIVTPTSGAGCLGATYVVTVPVNPQPVGADVTRATQCSNVAFNVSADNVTNGVAGVTFTWARDPLPVGLTQVTAGSGVGTIAETLRNLTSSQLSATYTVTPTSGAGCLGATYVVTVPINPEPVGADITRAVQCSNVAFSVSADNVTNGVGGSTFTWVRNALPIGLTQVVAGTGVGPIAETLRNLTAGQLSATYTVTPTSGVGCVGATYVVTVPVDPEPVGAAITRAAQCSNVGFSVSADNITNGVAGVTFTWTRNALPAGLTQVVAGTGVGPIAETLRNLTAGQLSATYTVTPTSGTGCVGATYVVTVPVDPEPVGADVTRAAQCSNVAFSLSANNITNGVAGVIFTWVRNALPAGLTQVVAGTGVGAIAETLQNLTGGQLSATYTVTPTSGTGCLGATYVVTVPVNPEPIGAAITRAPQCSNTAFSVSADNITNGVVGSTFTWVRNVLPVGLTQVAAGTGSGAIAETLRNQTGGQLSATYVVTPTSGAGCLGATYVVTVPVNPEPVAQALSTIERCSGDPIAFDMQDIIDNVAPFAGGNSVTSKFRYTVVADFPLEVSPAVFPGVFDRVVATNAPISETFSNLSYRDVKLTYTITPLSDPENCPGTPFTLEVIIHPEPVGSNVVDPVCSTSLNHDIQTQITNPVPGLPSVFTYTFTPDPGNPTVVPLAPAVPPFDRPVASNANITDQFSNTTGSPATVTYTITPYNAANPTCAGTPFTYQVIISPNPTGVSDTKAAKCSDVAFVEDPQNNIVPAVASTFTWTATYDFGLTGGVNNGTGVIAENLHNETAGQLFAHYTVTPKAGTCTGAPFFIDIPIDPEPVMLPALSAPAPPTCSTNAVSNNPIGVILQTNGVSVAADTYTIISVTVDPMLTPVVGPAATGVPFPANSPSPGESDAISLDSYRNTTSAQLTVVYRVMPTSADGCQGDPFDITVSINPEPVLATPAWPDVCSSNTGISNPVNVVLGTNGTSAAASSYQLINRTYSDGGPFSVVLPTGFTAPGVVVVGTSGSINLVKNDKYTNVSTVDVTVRYTIQATSSQGCVSELLNYDVVVNPEPVLFIPVPAPVCSDVITNITLVEEVGSAVATTFNINNIIRQPGLVAGGSNASIGLGQNNMAIFNDTFTNTTAGNLTVTYKIAPVTALGCVGAQRDLVLTIQPAPAVAALSKTVCTNEPSGITLSAEVTSAPVAVPFGFNILGVTIQAGLNQTAGGTGVRMGVTANEIANDQFENLLPSNVPLTVTYSIQGITSVGCTGPAKDIVLTVEPTILAVPVNNNTSICSATQTDIDLTSPTLPTSGTITFNYTAVSSIGGQMTGFVPAISNLPLNYKITDNLVNNSDNVATLTYNITPVANGAKNGAGCTGTPVPVVVNVEPKPKLTASPLVQTVCESDGVNVSPTNILLTSSTVPSVGTLEFNQISAVATGGMTLLSPLKTTYLNGETITDQWNNPTLSDQTVTYTLQPVVNGGLGCPGDNVVVTITVKPRPIINPVAPIALCSGEFRSIPLVTDIPGTFATWTVTPNANITGELNGGGGSLDITLFNTGFNVETVTYTVTPKFNNCDGIPTDIVITVNPTPNTVGLPPTITVCDGATLNVPLSSAVPGTTFDWVVTDVFNLEAPGFFDGNGTTINQVINNPNGFQAVLIYQITPTSPDGCVGLPKIMNVNVGSIVANVTPDQTSICSGRRIQMTNSSLGATSHRWFYRVQGTTAEIDVRTTPFVNYQLDNTTTTNPLVYEIVYQPSNGLCSIPDVVTPITVYRNVVAGFDEGTVPPIVGGTSTVNFTNTSNPVDGTQFRYEWDFGSATFASPATFVGATPPPVVYSQQGPYQVTVKAINIAAETAGLQCENTFFKNIVVPVLPLIADFTLDPPAGCFPTTVKVIENLSTGDIMEWKVVDPNGKVVAISGEDLPEFFISTPGLFNVQLTTRDSFTDQVEFANQDFEIYDLPIASFQARPTTVFVPDTELTTFNFSTGADFYQWDFGDGETSDEREPKHIYKIEGVYDIVMVAGFDHGGGIVCTDTLTQKVVAKQGGQTKIPNAFTPNPGGPSGGIGGGGGGGTFNDVFLPIVKGVEEFNMQIFDRWGNLIFESNSSNTGWDGYDRNGNILPAGVYIYKLTLRLSDGQRTTQIGDITMIR